MKCDDSSVSYHSEWNGTHFLLTADGGGGAEEVVVEASGLLLVDVDSIQITGAGRAVQMENQESSAVWNGTHLAVTSSSQGKANYNHSGRY